MGSSPTPPEYTGINETIFDWGQKKNIMPGAAELYFGTMDKYRKGLPKDIQDIYTKQGKEQIGSSRMESEQALEEAIAGSGTGVPVDALLRGKGIINSESAKAMAGLTDQLAMRNYDAKNQAYNQYLALMGLANEVGTGKQSFDMRRYQIDEENAFKPGEAIGAVLGAGGQVLGAGIQSGMTCFCYAELFGKGSPEYMYARLWAISNIGEMTRRGYIKLSAFLIPIMRRYPKFKNWFRRKIAVPCLEQMKNYYDEQLNIILSIMIIICNIAGRVFKLTKKDEKLLKTVFKV